MKKLFALFLVLALALTASVSLAGHPANGQSSVGTDESLQDVTPFKFEHRKSGIGCGSCPVYSAPYIDSYRAANGKASCDTNSKLDVGGFNEEGWLLVRYETNNGSTRTGWIPPKYVRDVKTPMCPHFFYVEQVAEEEITVTDNCLKPMTNSPDNWILDPGDTYYVVGRYNYYEYDLWYIEYTREDGQVAWGFIPNTTVD